MIKINALTKKFNKGKKNEIDALKSMNLELKDTGLYCIYGKSGSGKSTLMNMIGGLDRFDEGAIEMDGNSYVGQVSDEYRIDNIGYIFQNYCLDPGIDVYENVALGLRTIGITDEEVIFTRVMTALANVDMEEYFRRDVTTLSGGQQQRVAIARAMAKGSKIILADEPTGNLDEYNTIMVMDILKELSKSHLIILVTHEEALVSRYADRVIEIKDGEIVSETDGIGGEGSSEDKSKIFLGDMEKRQEKVGGIDIDFYGKGEPCRLEIVSDGGKYYIKSTDKNVVFVGGDSEVQLIHMSREDYFGKEKEKRQVTLKELSHIEPEKKRHVFSFSKAFKDGLHNDFGKKTKTKSKIFSVCIALLVISLLFVTASLGGNIKSFNSLDTALPDDTLLIYSLDGTNDVDTTNKVVNYINTSDNVKYAYFGRDDTELNFKSGSFESVTGLELISFGANYRDKANLKDAKFLRGKVTDNVLGIVPTTAVIKRACERGAYKVDDRLYDMIMKSKATFNNTDNSMLPLHVEGIIESDELTIYTSDAFIKNLSFETRLGVGIAEMYGFTVPDGKVLIDKIDFVDTDWILDDGLLHIGGKAESQGYEYIYFEEDSKLVTMNERQKVFMNYKTYKEAEPYLNGFVDGAKLYVVTNNIVGAIGDMENFGVRDEVLIDRGEMLDNAKESRLTDFTVSLVMTIIVFALIMLMSGLLMYANFTEKVKEVGIYRSIGVSKSNIIFKVFAESLASIILTAVIVLIVLGIPLMAMFNGMYNSAMYNSPYIQWWLYLAMFVLVVGGMSLLSIMPAMNTLKKTPREILTKYDI